METSPREASRVREAGAQLVFVHGVGGVRNGAAELRGWLEALATGAVRAGHSRMATALSDSVQVRACFVSYADLFMPEQAQGGGLLNLDDKAAAILVELMRAAVDAQLAREWDERERRSLDDARVQVAAQGQAQGAMNLVRIALNASTSLWSLPPLRRAGQWATPRLMLGDLAQVARYLARGEADAQGVTLDQRVRARLAKRLGDGHAVVVAHSLGTVVAMETLHECATEIPLFVTLGSPISMRTAVWPHLVPRPPRVPDCVQRWLNFWDRDDVIAVRPRLEDDLATSRSGIGVQSRRVDSDGVWVHTATKYLASPGVAGPVAEALTIMNEAVPR